MQEAAFDQITLPVLNKRVFRMGLASNYGMKADDIAYAAEHGVNYWLFSRLSAAVTAQISRAINADRERHVVALLDSAIWRSGPRRGVEKALRKLKTDYIDIYKLGWLGTASRFSPAIQETLLKLKQEGKVRALGCSIHDRPRAGNLAKDSILDALMLRYNAKHPGAERDIFPHLTQRNPIVVAYTATSWGQLIKPLKRIEMPPWPGQASTGLPPLSPELCYRFCLSSPHVHVTLTGPKTREQLVQNLKSVQAGPLSEQEIDWIRQYGKQVKQQKRLDYI